MIVEVWMTVNDGVESISVIPKSVLPVERRRLLGEYVTLELLREIEGADWTDVMKKHHRLMGWAEYQP